jgi:Putative addiction module component
MNTRVASLIEETRKLTPEEREELLVRLRLEFEDEGAEGTPEEIEAAWIEEAQRRVEEFERGETTSRPLEEVMAELRKLIPGP